jgi:hypothetical protein
MRKLSLVSTAALLAGFSFWTLSLVGTEVSAAASSGHPSKAAFCSADISVDKASASVDSDAAFLAVLKAHTAQITALVKNAPAGQVGKVAREIGADADAAIASNSASSLNNAPSGGAVDTYCGVDGMGSPLPKNFGDGKATKFCASFVPVYAAVGNAAGNSAATLAALTSHETQVSHAASELSQLPSSIKASARTTVQKAQTAISTKSAAALQGNGSGDASLVALYCGQNN